MPYIFVDIPVNGDWPSANDLDTRNAITDELDALGIGQLGGSGGGMGSMDFSYTVPDGAIAEATIKKVIAKHLPSREHSISISDD